MTRSSVKSVTEVTFLGKCPDIYDMSDILFSFFLSDRIFRLKD